MSPDSWDAAEPFARVAQSLRGGYVENRHFGAAAVCTPAGRVVATVGDPAVRVFLRSAAKPIQLLPLLMAGGISEFKLTDAEIAVMCSSHTGQVEHVERVGRLLGKAGFSEADLSCGIHKPLELESTNEPACENSPRTQLHNNCSGNHAGQLLACRLLGYSTADYLDSSHPLQRQTRDLVAQFASLDGNEIEVGVDGCGLSAYRLPLTNAARIYALLADSAAADLASTLREPIGRIINAMTSNPEMVGGPGRFTTNLIRQTGGRVLGKEGAKGFYGAAVKGPVALGVAVKIADGSEECRSGVVLEILRQAGALSSTEFAALRAYYSPPLVNHVGRQVGEIAPVVELVEADASEAARVGSEPGAGASFTGRKS